MLLCNNRLLAQLCRLKVSWLGDMRNNPVNILIAFWISSVVASIWSVHIQHYNCVASLWLHIPRKTGSLCCGCQKIKMFIASPFCLDIVLILPAGSNCSWLDGFIVYCVVELTVNVAVKFVSAFICSASLKFRSPGIIPTWKQNRSSRISRTDCIWEINSNLCGLQFCSNVVSFHQQYFLKFYHKLLLQVFIRYTPEVKN